MGSDVTGTTLRGLLVQDPRITAVWEAQSSHSQADPQPGAVEAQSTDTRLALQPSGSMIAGAALRIQTHEPGHPAPGGGGFIWRKSADGDTEWRGRDVPNVITGYEAIEWSGTGATVTGTKDPHAVTLSDGTVVIAYEDAIVGSQRLRVRSRPPGGSWGAAVTVRSDTPATTPDYLPCLCVLPGDDLLLAARYTDSIQSEDNIRVWRSVDKGATWALVSVGALRTAVDTSAATEGHTLRRMRMAHLDGQVLLVIDTISNDTSGSYTDNYHQYMSDSLGGRFDLVEIGALYLLVAFPSVVSTGTTFVVGYITEDTRLNRREVRILPDAATPLSTARAVEVVTVDAVWAEADAANDYAVDGDGAMCVGPDGALYMLSRLVLDWTTVSYYNWCTIRRSHDGGETWQAMGAVTIFGSVADGVWYQLDNTSPPSSFGTYPVNFAVTESEGRLVVVTNHAANPGTGDDSLSAIYLGGPSKVTMPGIRDARGDDGRSTWDQTGLPWDLPGDTVWNASGLSTTERLASGRFELVCSPLQSRDYSITPAATMTESIIVRHAFQVNAGGDDNNDRINIDIRLDDSSNGYDVSIRIDAAGFSVHDNTAASNVGSPVTQAGPVDIIVALGPGSVSVWYRPYLQDADREWVAGPSGAVSDSGGATGSNLIQWGVVTTGPATADVYWYEWHAIIGGDAGAGLHDGFTNPDDLMPAYYAGQGRRVWVDDGAYITATDGPAFVGDLYNYDARYGFPVERILTAESPTPRVGWRSTDTTQQQIAFQLDSGFGVFDAGYPGSDTIGVSVLGANFRTGKVQGYLVGTGWVDLVAFDAAAGLSWIAGQWAREGGSLSAGGGILATGPYLHPGEFAGGYVDIGGTVFRRIATNTGGIGGAPNYAGKHATILIEDAELADPATGFTLEIVPRNFTVLVNLLGVQYAGYRLVIDAQSNPDGYFEIGNIVIGWAEFFGHQYSRGRVIETEAGAGAARSYDDVARSRFISPPRRTVELAWTEGVSTSQIWGDSASPDYLTASSTAGAEAVAIARATPLQLAGLLDSLHREGAPQNPAVVYLPSVGRVTGGVDNVILNRRHQFVAGQLDPRIRLESILGEENSPTGGEVWRVAQAVIREMV